MQVAFFTQADMVRYIVERVREFDGGAVCNAFGRAVIEYAMRHNNTSILQLNNG